MTMASGLRVRIKTRDPAVSLPGFLQFLYLDIPIPDSVAVIL
jgi:hypothetical protein